MATEVVVEYTLKFVKHETDYKNVKFSAQLNVCEIDSLVFLFSKYYDQSKNVKIKGLTFFNEFNKCVDVVKRNFENKHENNEIKQLFTVFLKHEFMTQVPNFRKIMQYLEKYFKPIKTPNVSAIFDQCDLCRPNLIDCIACKTRYLAQSISLFDEGIQTGWDIFLRPMFGLPIFVYVLIKTDYQTNGLFTADDLITNSFAIFFQNLLDDKASMYLNYKSVQPLLNECRRVTAGISADQLEYLLCMLRNKNTGDSLLFVPFKNFILQLAQKTKIKHTKINKIAAVIFTGFYLRLYIESAIGKLVSAPPTKIYKFNALGEMSAFELELRNVCHFILPEYTNEQFESFIAKLAAIKQDLVVPQYIVTEKHIRQLIAKHNLLDDFSVLLNNNV
ncbi:P45 [Buzura suppressaria nucleopolyhedrovirus]|uniref:p45 n=1 Tax=Buzura suppressaria nuclear polyhedrosis virus TaxID=74320 RepID=W5VKR6_NPVBS|nr:P45 [Buzura suppressaria nucleopolyhedrovirus]AHH82668.1 P45 [Buzura suppressaria nucleopolyhedrovirus]AKN91051.1 P45 [Buzura suppressaria nucleopolyhedrovirus]